MRQLEDFELTAVSGGDHWGHESGSGSIDEDRMSNYANSYQMSNGSWGPPGSASCSAVTTVSSTTTTTSTSTSAGCTLSSKPPYLECSSGLPTSTTTTTTSKSTVVTCTH